MMAPPNKSLRAKSAARMMAVQIAYSYQSLSKTPNASAMQRDIDAFKEADQDAEFSSVFKEKPHAPTLTKLLEGYADHKETLEPIAQESLHEHWKPERVNPLLLIILQLATFELDHVRELADGVIVTEYTDIAARLLDAGDIDFVHASLKQLAAKLRG